ncbi:MAG: lipopolysaccharide biosynthesis protein [Myxococcota bacterium]
MANWRTLSLNTGLRGGSIAIKSAMMIALAAFLPAAAVGEYGLLAASIQLSSYVYGLELHFFTQRELSLAELPLVRSRLRGQFLIYGTVYFFGSVGLWAILHSLGVSIELLPHAVAIAIFQHTGVELYRVLVRLQRPVDASVLLFLRDASWALPCLGRWWWQGEADLLDLTWSWLGGAGLAVAYGLFVLRKILPATGNVPIDWSWLRRGLRVGLISLPGSLSVRGIFTIDRMLLAKFVTKEQLGAYVFFAGLATALAGLFESGILVSFNAQLLEAVKCGDEAEARRAFGRVRRICLWVPSIFAIIGIVAGWAISLVLSNHAYLENLVFLPMAFAAQLFFSYSHAWNIWLYARRRDRFIILINIAAFVVMLLLGIFVAPSASPMVIPMAVITATFLLFTGKRFLVMREERASHHCG